MKKCIIIISLFIWGCSSTKQSRKQDKELQALIDSTKKKIREIEKEIQTSTIEFWKNGKLIYKYQVRNGDTIWIKKQN